MLEYLVQGPALAPDTSFLLVSTCIPQGLHSDWISIQPNDLVSPDHFIKDPVSKTSSLLKH